MNHDGLHILVANVFFAPYSYGGATIVAEQVAHQLARHHGCQITALSVVNRPDLTPYTVMKVEQGGIPNYLINLPGKRDYTEIYSNPRVSEIVSDLLEQLRPDLLHAHCIQDLGAGIISAAKRRDVPVVLSVHDFWWLCERQFMVRANQRYCGQDPIRLETCRGCVDNLGRARVRSEVLLAEAAQADLITFPSQFAHDLSARSGMTAPRMAVWKNGVRGPGPGFFQAQAARRARDSRLVFGHVGGPSAIKGWPVISDAFETLDRDDFVGILVDGSIEKSWWAGHDLSKMQGEWRIHPRFSQDEMDAFYAEIDVLLFLSQWKETYGLTIREAAARGIRVLQTDSGGTTEWDGADPGTMLAIGDGATQLRPALQAELDRTGDWPAPMDMVSYGDQAKAFMDMTAPLLGRGG